MVTSQVSPTRSTSGRLPVPPRGPGGGAAPPPAARVHPLAHVGVRAALVAGSVAVLGLWWVDAVAGELVTAGGAVTAVGRVTGLLGAYLVLTQILLMARLPWFERAVGLDRLTGWHRGLGTNVVVLLAAHVLLIVEGYSLRAHRGAAGEAWVILGTYPAMLKALTAMVLFVVVAVSSAATARRRLSYEGWYLLHLGAYVAVALAFFHQIDTGADFVGRDPRHVAARVVWTAGYLTVAGCVLWWRVGHPVRVWLAHRLRVQEVTVLAPGVVSIVVAGRDLDRLGARAGQFLLWRFLCRGHLLTAHPYSLSQRPNGRQLRITVKDAGDHSGAVSRLRVGTPVLAEGPYGHFTVSTATARRVLLIAGGSGVGPIRALAEELSSTRMVDGHLRSGNDVVVVYRVGHPTEKVFTGEFAAAAAAGRLRAHYLLGHRRDLPHDPLDAGSLAHLIPDIADREVFLCGPDGMTAAVRRSLTQLRVPRTRVHTEMFSS